MAFTVTTWTDYLCPWAYLGRRHSQWIRNAGVDVMIRGYELHPDVPPEGRPIRPGGSYDRLLDRLQAESRANGVDFNKPSRTPNTRAALELLELVHHPWPDRALACSARSLRRLDRRSTNRPSQRPADPRNGGRRRRRPRSPARSRSRIRTPGGRSS
ncbi:MAG: hypothetical protein R2710_05175 [Acidimicrobiales bacterium]